MNITDTLEYIRMSRGGGFSRRRYGRLKHVDVPRRRYMDGERLDRYNDEYIRMVDDYYGALGYTGMSYEEASMAVPYNPVVNPLGRGVKSVIARSRGQLVRDDIEGERPYNPITGSKEY